MFTPEVSEKLQKILKKILKKDRVRYIAATNKMDEIIKCDNPDRYKNLKYDLKEMKRVHIDSHFVLIFHFNRKDKMIRFEDLQHHDHIYLR
ncbi:MAG: addiction module toxin RelE [Candidatus Diapherotrites archaeon]